MHSSLYRLMYDSELCRGGQSIACSIGQLSRLRQHMAEASIGTLYRHLYRQCLHWQETQRGWYVIWKDFIADLKQKIILEWFTCNQNGTCEWTKEYLLATELLHILAVYFKYKKWHYTVIIIPQNMLQFHESYVNKCLAVTSRETRPVYSGYFFGFSWMAIQEKFKCISIYAFILYCLVFYEMMVRVKRSQFLVFFS